jgi:hypothetical protein
VIVNGVIIRRDGQPVDTDLANRAIDLAAASRHRLLAATAMAGADA